METGCPISKGIPVELCVGTTERLGGSKEIVFLRPLLVVPGTFGPMIDEVYLMISVSGGSRTPPKIPTDSLKKVLVSNKADKIKIITKVLRATMSHFR